MLLKAIYFHDRFPFDFAVTVVRALIPRAGCSTFKDRVLLRDPVPLRKGFHHGFAVRQFDCQICLVDFADELFVFLQNAKAIDQQCLRVFARLFAVLDLAVSVDAFGQRRNLLVHVRSQDERFG